MFRPLRFAVLLAGVTLAISAWAQPAPDESPAADPPTRVARLSYLKGDVSFVPAGENDWVEAQLNRPLITGDKLWTDRGARAELGIGPATLRIDQNTSFDFLNLDDKVAQVELTQGSLNLHVRRLYDEQTYEVDTPTLAFVVNRVGDVRIDVLPDGQSTVVTVLQGGGDAYGEGGARFRVEEGQAVTFHDPQLQQYEVASVEHRDDFDQFYTERDRHWDSSTSRRYVSEEVIGYEDLDDNGNWSDEPEYGNVWYPTTVAVDWAPYHHGHWGWVGAYGWTWIDDAPWGFAPFHYGRWAYIHNRWGWCPGPVAVRAVYAPALVAFVGGGVSIGISTGPVGWFPLGPRDVYFPSYRVSERYFTRLNVSNTRVINNVTINNYYGNYSRGNVDFERINYSNRNVNGAVVAVSHETFVGARPVAREAIAVNQQTFANGGRVSGFAAIAPTRTSLVATTAVARTAPPPQVASRQIVAASKPPPPVAPFAQRESQLQRNPGQPLPVTQLHAPAATAATGVGAGANAGRPNVRVVTNTGVPARTAAPTLPTRPVAGAANGAGPNAGGNARVAPNANAGRENPGLQGRGNLPAVQNNATANGRPNATTGREGPEERRNVPAVQNNATVNANGGRPNANQHLDSARFAHPQQGGPAVTGRDNGAGQPPARATAQPTQSVQRTGGPQNAGQGNRYQQADRGALNEVPHQPQTTQTPPQQNATPYSARGGRDNPNADRNATNAQGNAPVGNAQGREYHTPIQQQQQQQYHPQPQVQRETQQYHAPQPQVQRETQQYHAPQPQVQREQPQYHAPAPQPQAQQYHAPPPPPQQQYRAPQQVQQQNQMQQMHQAPPPQPQVQRAPPPGNRAPPPQEKSKDKKDDDKHGH